VGDALITTAHTAHMAGGRRVQRGMSNIAQVTEGMSVVDSTGAEVGTVERVKMGDPEAVTTAGQREDGAHGLIDAVARELAGVEPDLPPTLAARLLRTGYIKIDGKGLLGRDRYAAADQIAGVTDDAVTLTVPRDELPTEQ
jgi:hypothetical protein